MSAKASRKRGRPQEIDNEKTFNFIISQKHRVITTTGEILGKNDKVWTDLQTELKKIIPKVPASLYTFVTCDRAGVKTELLKDVVRDQFQGHINESDISKLHEGSTWQDSACCRPESYDFSIDITASVFESLLVMKEYKISNKKGRKTNREVIRMREDEWTDFISLRVWNEHHLTCAFNFHGHYITKDGSSGRASGTCKCGGTIFCDIEKNADNVVKIKCQTTKGKGKCGKRQLRAKNRDKYGKELQVKTVHALRSEMANDLILNDDDDEPPLLYTSGVLRTLKWEERAKNHLHSDPWIALHLLSVQEMPHEIQYYCTSPFFVQWCTKHQQTVYKQLMDKGHVCLAIDASGCFSRELQLPNKSTTGPIYLYSGVAKTDGGQIPIMQMLSARHTTGAIAFWLSETIVGNALPFPKEVVIDGSLALMAATVKAFTHQRSITEYADLFFNGLPERLPVCYIRRDVAHFLKNYRDLLSELLYPVRQFYLAGIGKIIRCVDRLLAERIIRALLTISQCENDGPQVNGKKSAVQEEKEFMEALLTEEDYVFEAQDESFTVERQGIPDQHENENHEWKRQKLEPSKWYDWACELNTSVLRRIKQAPGKPRSANAHFCEKFARRLIEDLSLLPIWSCITWNYFGYGRNPASSSHVEIEFKNIRHLLLPSYGYHPPIRADDFIRIYSKHVDGLSKITRTKISGSNCDTNMNTRDAETNSAQVHDDESNRSTPSEASDDNGNTICDLHDQTAQATNKCSVCHMIISPTDTCSLPHERGTSGFHVCKNCKLVQSELSGLQSNDVDDAGTISNNLPEISTVSVYGQHAADYFNHMINSLNNMRTMNGSANYQFNKGYEGEDANNNSFGATKVSGCGNTIPPPQFTSSPYEHQNINETILDLRTNVRHEAPCRNLNFTKLNQQPNTKASVVCTTCGDSMEEITHCALCSCPVHYIDRCSVSFNDENTAEPLRMCFKCKKLHHFAETSVQLTGQSYSRTDVSNIAVHENTRISQVSDTVETCCPVCKRAVGTAHMCKDCQRAVHAIDTCSIADPHSAEGFGQTRICLNCCNSQEQNFKEADCPTPAEFRVKCSTCGKIGDKCCSCLVCRVQIHPSDHCSLPCNEDERGVAQSRICKKCSKLENIHEIIQMHCIENWMGQAKKFQEKEVRGFYLQEKFSKNTFAVNKKLAKIPILKTGAHPDLKAVQLNKKKVDLRNTCAFDSAFQLFLSVLFDSDVFSIAVHEFQSQSLFLKMLLDVKKTGINKMTYRLRAEILHPLSSVGREDANCIVIDARMTIGGLCRNLFKSVPCFREVSRCNTCDFLQEKEFALFSITREALKQTDHNKAIENEIMLPQNRKCSEYTHAAHPCMGRITNDLMILGGFIIFEIQLSDEREKLALKDIPLSIKLSKMTEEYPLRGIVGFDVSDGKANDNDQEIIGHYKVFAYRNHKWTEFDHKKKNRPDNYLTSTHLILYAQ